MQITQAEAERLLRSDMKRFEEAVTRLITEPLTQQEYDATVSFCYNVGTSALEHSTFRRRINGGDSKPQCFKAGVPEAGVNGPDGPLPGLVQTDEKQRLT